MNPFTQSLLSQVKDRHLVDFVTHWDTLEAIVVRTYKGEGASTEDTAEHARTRAWLLLRYSKWQKALATYWPRTRAGGKPVSADPFSSLLAPEHASDFVDNWNAMQILPAARESLNMLLLDLAG